MPAWKWAIAIFQFRYGAIETNVCRQNELDCSNFQFRYGAIETQSLIFTSARLYATFNSAMVRLRPFVRFAAYSAFIAFQFRYGAIETRQLYLSIHAEPSFNSGMVRLRQEGFYVQTATFVDFQFRYGAIETSNWQ